MPATTTRIGLFAAIATTVAASSAIAAPSAIESVVYAFQGGTDGYAPQAGVINVGGVLYGTTAYSGSGGHGTVFSVTPAGTEAVLHSFTGGTDGAFPFTPLLDVNGALYGTTAEGGSTCERGEGCGIVFALTAAGVETILHLFKGAHDGLFPASGLVKLGGKFFGTTPNGGESNQGTVYQITLTSHEKVLHSFLGTTNDGIAPEAGLLNVKGTLYGTTQYGGSIAGCGGLNCGTVFSITAAGTENVLCSFAGGSDGAEPMAPLVNVDGTFYGTTKFGGNGYGTVFSMTPAGAEKVLYAFTGGTDAAYPNSGLVNVGNTLYGVSLYGGANGHGVVYKISRTAVETVIYSFQGGSDGAQPEGSLLNVNGTLYGVTQSGGVASCNAGGGCGTVFKITP